MNAAVNSLQGQLYQNIKGYYNLELVETYLNAPSKEIDPVQYICYMLRIYTTERRGVYAPIISVLSFLERLAGTLEFNDFLDDNWTLRGNIDLFEQSMEKLESFGLFNTDFESFFENIIRPFQLDMIQYKSRLSNFQKWQGNYDGIASYKEMYKTQHLERIRHFMLDVAQFLRVIPYDDEIKTNLCQNIAFSIETTCGLYDPLESLFEKVSPLMITSMDRSKRERSPEIFEAKRARR